jgi:HK97 family phage portal protein
MGLAAATEKFGAQLFKNGAKPGGILKHPAKFSNKEVADRVRASWEEATGGENAHKTAVLEEGMEWVRIGMSSEDAQFLQTRQFQTTDIARFFRVPAYKILGDTDKSKGWSTLEQQATDYLTDSLLPWLTRWEQGIAQRLLAPAERIEYFAEHLVDGMLRGDTKSRNEAYAIQRQNGILSANEWRERENMNPRTDPGGDEYLVPLNMGVSGEEKPTDGEILTINEKRAAAGRDPMPGGDAIFMPSSMIPAIEVEE